MTGAALQQLRDGLLHGLGRSVAEETGGVDVAHDDMVGPHPVDEIRHIHGVAEVVGLAPGLLDGFGHEVSVVAAVVVDHGEGLVLDGLHDLAHIGSGELLLMTGGDQACQRLGDDDTVGSGLLQLGDVGDGESHALFQQGVQQLRLIVAEHHGLAHVHQTAGQAEGTDGAGEDGLVLHGCDGLADGLHADTGPAGPDTGNGQSFGLFQGGDQGAPDGGDFVVKELDLSSEGFRLHGEIHEADTGGRIRAPCHFFQALGLKIAAVQQLPDGNAVQEADAGEREQGKGFLFLGLYLLPQPFIHIHRMVPPHQGRPVRDRIGRCSFLLLDP